jgi:alpha-D-ribose 1-methylphosphonate 5-triphosphate synthase subunit PhnI
MLLIEFLLKRLMSEGFVFSQELTALARQQAANTAITIEVAQHLKLIFL